MDLYDDDMDLYKPCYGMFDDSIKVLFYYLMFLFFAKWFLN